MKIALHIACIYGLFSLALLPACATSDLTLSLDNATSQTGTAGSVVSFTGVLTNNTSTTLTLLTDGYGAITGPGTIDDSPFQNNISLPYLFGTPVTLASGSSQDIGLFNINILGTANPGDIIQGYFSVQAQDNSSNSYDSGSQYYSVKVTPSASAAPEPSQVGMLALIGLGLGGLLLRARRRSLTA